MIKGQKQKSELQNLSFKTSTILFFFYFMAGSTNIKVHYRHLL